MWLPISIFIAIRMYSKDVNECEEGISGCQHMCKNTVGSYYCDCYSGYHLKDDGHSCEGKLSDQVLYKLGTQLRICM